MTRQKYTAVHSLKKFSLVAILAFITVPLAGLFLNSPVDPSAPDSIEVQISPGQSLDQITKKLHEQKLVRSPQLLKALIVFKGNAKKIQSGLFDISASYSTSTIADVLTRSRTEQVTVTIPEGLRREEIAFLIASSLPDTTNFDPLDFISQTADLEGMLFPDTYALEPQTTTKQVIDVLNSRFNQKILELNIAPQDLSRIVILASLIEREASSDQERPIIAGILMNRLNNDWPLQIDATVQYALVGNCTSSDCIYWPRPLTRANLDINSAYNTYKYQGLPAGAIANPGFASLQAAAAPSPTDYWFYIHDSSGQIHYAASADQHAENVCTYLKKDC